MPTEKKDEPPDQPPFIDWTIDQEAWRLESLVDGPYRLTKKPIADLSEDASGPFLVTEDDLRDLLRVLAARERLED